MAKVLLIGESGDTVRYSQAEVDGVPVVGSVDLDSGFTGPALVSEVCRAWEGPGGSRWWVPVSEPQAEVGASPLPVPAEVPGADGADGARQYTARQVRRLIAREVARVQRRQAEAIASARAAGAEEVAGVSGVVVAPGQYLVAHHTAEADTRAATWVVVSGALAVGAGVCVFAGLSTISLSWFGAAVSMPVAGLVAGILWEARCRLGAWHPVRTAEGGYRVRSGRNGAEVYCRRSGGASGWRPLSGFVVVDWGDRPGAVAREDTAEAAQAGGARG